MNDELQKPNDRRGESLPGMILAVIRLVIGLAALVVNVLSWVDDNHWWWGPR